MTTMTPPDTNQINFLSLLQQFGLNPNQFGPERLNKLMEIAELVKNPEDMTPEIAKDIIDVLGVDPKKYLNKKVGTNEKIGRNDLCTCNSGKKFKKCCGKN